MHSKLSRSEIGETEGLGEIGAAAKFHESALTLHPGS